MIRERAFNIAAAAMMILLAGYIALMQPIIEALPPGPLGGALILLISGAIWTGIVYLTIGIFNWLARR